MAARRIDQLAAGPGAESDSSRRDYILVVAAGLFRKRGYLNTTMTEIARECGLGQSSLYYWFRQKEDILLGLLAVNRASLDFAEQLAREGGSPAVGLLRLLRLDIRELCSSPVDICEVEVLAEQQPEVFTEFWADCAASAPPRGHTDQRRDRGRRVRRLRSRVGRPQHLRR